MFCRDKTDTCGSSCQWYTIATCITTIKGTTYILLVMTASLLFNGEGEHLRPEGKVLCLFDHLLVWRHRLCSHHNMTLQAKWRNRCQSEFCVDSSHCISVILFCLTARMEGLFCRVLSLPRLSWFLASCGLTKSGSLSCTVHSTSFVDWYSARITSFLWMSFGVKNLVLHPM